jgi:hypothetical protein
VVARRAGISSAQCLGTVVNHMRASQQQLLASGEQMAAVRGRTLLAQSLSTRG